ncbi:kinase-like protein [Phanerochaete sordida]|uniref:non-specific serine/threonine protein kinase n=1 Tax=Phanerochaete sordida TaxID=48140 RepID=A0A9P3G655_9APHY|nr:kinase-like protein [Phanerochaete sordida]
MRLPHLTNLFPGLRRRPVPDDRPSSDGNPATSPLPAHPVTPHHLRRLPHLLLKRARRADVRDVFAHSVHSEATGDEATFIGSDTYGTPSVARDDTHSSVQPSKAPKNARNVCPPPIEVNVAQQVEVTLQSLELEQQRDSDPFAARPPAAQAEDGTAPQYLLPQPHRNAPPRPRRSPLREAATAQSSPSLSPKALSDAGFRESPSPPMRTPSASSMALLMRPASRALQETARDKAHIPSDQGQDRSSTDAIAPSSPPQRDAEEDAPSFPERRMYRDVLSTIDFLLNDPKTTPEQKLESLQGFLRGSAAMRLFVPFGQGMYDGGSRGEVSITSNRDKKGHDSRHQLPPSFPPLLDFPAAPAALALALQHAPNLAPVKLPSISPDNEAAHVAAGRLYFHPNALAATRQNDAAPPIAPPNAGNKRKRSAHSLSTFVFPAGAPPAASAPHSSEHYGPGEGPHQHLPPDFVITHREHALTVVRKLGAGAYGAVYLVRDAAGAEFAAKVMPRAYGAYDTVRTEFEVLRDAAARGERFVARLVMAFEDARFLYFVMEAYVGDLVDVPALTIHKHGAKAHFDYYHTIAQLVHGLARLHALGYAHLDIKPENILVARTGAVAYADFGLARRVDAAGRVRGGAPFGTVGYDAPEGYLRGLFAAPPPSPSYPTSNTEGKGDGDEASAVTQKADVWSLGITLVRLVTDATPYAELVRARLRAWGAAGPGGDAFEAMREGAARLAVAEHDPLCTPEVRRIRAHDPFLYALLAKMLVRDPRLRWTAEQLKTHEYFRYVDWDELERCEPLYDVSRGDEARSADSSSPPPGPFDFSYPRSQELGDQHCERCEEAAPARKQQKVQHQRNSSGDTNNTDNVR